jgi:hypothetical protein
MIGKRGRGTQVFACSAIAAAVRKALVAFMAAAAMRKRAATKSALAGIAHAFASAQSTLQKSATIGEVTRQTA